MQREVNRLQCVIRFIGKVLVATVILNMSNLEGEEIFDPSHLGQADEVVQERVSDDELIFIKG